MDVNESVLIVEETDENTKESLVDTLNDIMDLRDNLIKVVRASFKKIQAAKPSYEREKKITSNLYRLIIIC